MPFPPLSKGGNNIILEYFSLCTTTSYMPVVYGDSPSIMVDINLDFWLCASFIAVNTSLSARADGMLASTGEACASRCYLLMPFPPVCGGANNFILEYFSLCTTNSCMPVVYGDSPSITVDINWDFWMCAIFIAMNTSLSPPSLSRADRVLASTSEAYSVPCQAFQVWRCYFALFEGVLSPSAMLPVIIVFILAL